MAVTSIAIHQSNISGSVNLFGVHNPLCFMADATFTGLAPELLYFRVYDESSVLLNTYYALPYSDLDNVTRRFIFIGDTILKSYLTDFSDQVQTNDTLAFITNMQKILICDFVWFDAWPNPEVSSSTITFVISNTSSQIGESVAQSDLYNNVSELIIGYEAKQFYVYFYNDNVLNTGTSPQISAPFNLTSIGFWRLKYHLHSLGDNTITLVTNGTNTYTKTVRIKPICTNDKLIKYINSKGQYRFYAFNRYYEQKDKITSLGMTNELITNILTAQTNKKSVGNKHERTLSLCADDVPNDELLLLKDLFVSPIIFLYVGTSGDDLKDWLQVSISNTEFISRPKKANFSKVNFDFLLPEQYTLKLV